MRFMKFASFSGMVDAHHFGFDIFRRGRDKNAHIGLHGVHCARNGFRAWIFPAVKSLISTAVMRLYTGAAADLEAVSGCCGKGGMRYGGAAVFVSCIRAAGKRPPSAGDSMARDGGWKINA